jgi:ADP-ribose pyrophosphatase YjhB (NUDIX family)
MAKIIYGDRVSKQGKLAIGCSAWIVDPETEKVLLVQRADNKKWAVPGGYMEPGESVSEACQREVLEETGIRVNISHLIGVYNNPHLLVEYPDGNQWQLIILHFAAEFVNGNIAAREETINVGYFSLAETFNLDIGAFDRQRIKDGFNLQNQPFIRNDIRI